GNRTLRRHPLRLHPAARQEAGHHPLRRHGPRPAPHGRGPPPGARPWLTLLLHPPTLAHSPPRRRPPPGRLGRSSFTSTASSSRAPTSRPTRSSSSTPPTATPSSSRSARITSR